MTIDRFRSTVDRHHASSSSRTGAAAPACESPSSPRRTAARDGRTRRDPQPVGLRWADTVIAVATPPTPGSSGIRRRPASPPPTTERNRSAPWSRPPRASARGGRLPRPSRPTRAPGRRVRRRRRRPAGEREPAPNRARSTPGSTDPERDSRIAALAIPHSARDSWHATHGTRHATRGTRHGPHARSTGPERPRKSAPHWHGPDFQSGLGSAAPQMRALSGIGCSTPTLWNDEGQLP